MLVARDEVVAREGRVVQVSRARRVGVQQRGGPRLESSPTLTIILPRSLREIAHELICEVFISVNGEEVFKEHQGEPGLSIQSTYPDDLDPGAWASHKNSGH